MRLFRKDSQKNRSYKMYRQDPSHRPWDKGDEKIVCTHGKMKGKFHLNVLGVSCEIKITKKWFCPSCLHKYLNKYSTLCASCGRPIFPGEPVGVAWKEAFHPYTHLTFKCCYTGEMLCGRWGEGMLVTLYELCPEEYPKEKECSVIELMFYNEKEVRIINLI